MGKEKNKLETWGNETTMNLNPIVHQNVQASLYFKSLYEKRTFHEVLQEVKNHVTNLEPFLKGRTASTAFCLLFKFWTLRLTVKQLMNLVECKDNTFVRALGFLYLRYVCKPSGLWDWFAPYLDDEDMVTTAGGVRKTEVTIGQLCRSLLTEQKFLNTMLPRIPVPVMREVEQKLKDYDNEARASTMRSHEVAPRRPSPDYGMSTRPRRPSPDYGPGSVRRRSRSPDLEVDDFGRARRRSRSRSKGDRGQERERDRTRDRYDGHNGRRHRDEERDRDNYRRSGRDRYDRYVDEYDRRRGYADRDRRHHDRRYDDDRYLGDRLASRERPGSDKRDLSRDRRGGHHKNDEEDRHHRPRSHEHGDRDGRHVAGMETET